MKTALTSALTTFIVIFAGAFLVYNFLPLSWIEVETSGEFTLGAITTIQGSDTLSSSRTTINDNFTDLDITKMEMSTTSVLSITTLSSLSSIGTITTGTWGATDITVANGGTGLSTLTANAVMLGAGTSNVNFVSGLGLSGQFLTSNGAASDPTWTTSSVSEGAEYNWTGLHDWQATTSLAVGAEAAVAVFGTLVFEGVGTTTLDFSGTAANTASSTAMVQDADGKISHVLMPRLLIAEATATAATSGSTTAFALTIPANTFTSGNQAVIKGQAIIAYSGFSDGGDEVTAFNLLFGDDWIASSTISGGTNGQLDSDTGEGVFDFYIVYDGTNQLGGMKYVASDTSRPEVIGSSVVIPGMETHSATESVSADALVSLVLNVTASTWTMKSVYAEISFR